LKGTLQSKTIPHRLRVSISSVGMLLVFAFEATLVAHHCKLIHEGVGMKRIMLLLSWNDSKISDVDVVRFVCVGVGSWNMLWLRKGKR